ncbi:MAG: hypothetical protein KC800_31370 [Candidatus Eremiobacteraeota bacterium]|nr:hypothetical protein [Candidatus Eremiobacteraeota bacterium]
MRIQNFLQSGIGRVDPGVLRQFPVDSELPVNRLTAFRPTAPVVPTPAPAPATPAQPAAPARSGVENLQLFGGDRKTAIGTLIASGAKAENPDVGFFGDVLRKIFGGTKTKSKQISPTQTITSKVRVKNFNLEELRLSTKDGNTTRHIDFGNQKPGGGTAQVKDAGTVIAQGQVERMFEQTVTAAPGGRKIENNYFDPKTGQNFLRTTEVSSSTETTKMGTVQSKKAKSSLRTIEVLGADGEADRRYTFSYGRSVKLENLDDQGKVVSTYNMAKGTDFFGLVDRLSTSPPSGRTTATPVFAGGGGGREFLGARSLMNAH